MKLELSREIKVRVLDVSMPIRRSMVRNDLRLIAKIANTEHNGSLAGRDGENIREMLGLKPNSWKRVIEEGEGEHNLWSDRQLTEKGRQCAQDGVVLDHEDGPHRLWVIDAPEPIGLKIIHIEAWADIDVKTNELGKEHQDKFVKRIRNEGLEHTSVIDSGNRCRFKPPGWWTRWIKRDPIVQEHPNLATSVDLLCSWAPGDASSTFSARGKLAGIIDKHQAFEGPLDVEISPSADQMAGIVASALSSKVSGGQEWEPESKVLKTDVNSIDDEAMERMRMDIDLGQINDGRIGDWSKSILKDIELRARDSNSAMDWIATLFWKRNDPIHRTDTRTKSIIQEISSESAFQKFTFEDEKSMLHSLVSINNAPEGAKWLFNTTKDLSLAISKEETL